jgi:hypothetical protein
VKEEFIGLFRSCFAVVPRHGHLNIPGESPCL